MPRPSRGPSAVRRVSYTLRTLATLPKRSMFDPISAS